MTDSNVQNLDFLVIGVQKGGTTTLWQLLRDHPAIWLPGFKEAPFFTYEEAFGSWPRYLSGIGVPADASLLRGTVTPDYMHGRNEMTTRVLARRIAEQLPDVKLIALLRDPVERAQSQYRMERRRGREARSFEEMVREELAPEGLHAARTHPHDCNTYVIQGEYGRILGEYLEYFPRESLCIGLIEELERHPPRFVERVLEFLGAQGEHTPPDEWRRSFASGDSPRVPDAALQSLLASLDSSPRSEMLAVVEEWARQHPIDQRGRVELDLIVARWAEALPEREGEARFGARWELEWIWNVAPSPAPPMDSAVRVALEDHFAGDATRLREVLGADALPPWLAAPDGVKVRS